METLATRIARDGALPEQDAVGWIIRLAKGLDPIHALRVAHGSITAEAVKIESVSRKSRGFLIDARLLLDQLAYHSPERAYGDPISPANDTWAVAVVLYFALTGTLPFQGATDRETRQKIRAASPAPLASFDVGDERLQAIVDQAFSTDPAERFARLRDLREALEAWHPDPDARNLPPLDDPGDISRNERLPMSERASQLGPADRSSIASLGRTGRGRAIVALPKAQPPPPKSARPTMPPSVPPPAMDSVAAEGAAHGLIEDDEGVTMVRAPTSFQQYLDAPATPAPPSVAPAGPASRPPSTAPASRSSAPGPASRSLTPGPASRPSPAQLAASGLPLLAEDVPLDDGKTLMVTDRRIPASIPRMDPDMLLTEDAQTLHMPSHQRHALQQQILQHLSPTEDRPTAPAPPPSPEVARAAGAPAVERPSPAAPAPALRPASQDLDSLAEESPPSSPRIAKPTSGSNIRGSGSPAASSGPNPILPVALPDDHPPVVPSLRSGPSPVVPASIAPPPVVESSRPKGGAGRTIAIVLGVFIAAGAGAFFAFRPQISAMLGMGEATPPASAAPSPGPSASAAPTAPASASAPSPSAAAPGDSASAAPTASVSAAPTASASASGAASGNPAASSVNSCMMPFFPSDTFIEIRPNLDNVCKYPDPRDGAMAIRTEIVRGGKRRGVTDGGREWSVLGWYEMATYAIFASTCCPSPPDYKLPVSIPTCDIETPLKALAKLASSADADDAKINAAVDDYTKAIKCVARAGAYDAFNQKGGPQGGQDVAFMKVLGRVRASFKKK